MVVRVVVVGGGGAAGGGGVAAAFYALDIVFLVDFVMFRLLIVIVSGCRCRGIWLFVEDAVLGVVVIVVIVVVAVVIGGGWWW